jgi:hypothetical protein
MSLLLSKDACPAELPLALLLDDLVAFLTDDVTSPTASAAFVLLRTVFDRCDFAMHATRLSSLEAVLLNLYRIGPVEDSSPTYIDSLCSLVKLRRRRNSLSLTLADVCPFFFGLLPRTLPSKLGSVLDSFFHLFEALPPARTSLVPSSNPPVLDAARVEALRACSKLCCSLSADIKFGIPCVLCAFCRECPIPQPLM